MGDINMITMKNIIKFQDSVIVFDHMGDKFNKDIVYYFTEGRNKNIQMIVMCHKTAQIENMAKMNCDSIFIMGQICFRILVQYMSASMTSMA